MPSQPVSSLPPRLAGLLLGASYVLLVLITVFTSFWTQHQFDRAEAQRCDLLVVQIRLTEIQVSILSASNPPPPPEQQAEIDAQARRLKALIVDVCPDVSLPQGG